MSRLARTVQTSIGAKGLMAVTGIALMGFVLAHMIGNLQIFSEPEKINAYAHFLKSLGPGLWIMRIGLLVIFVAHVWAAVKVSRASREARPADYSFKKKDLVTSYAARTMLMSGVIVALFLAYHLMHFTLGWVDFAGSYGHMTILKDGTEVPDVYKMVIDGFRHPLTAITYVLANLVLALHLSHGAASLFQTLGFRNRENATTVKRFGIGFGVIVAIGNCSMPLAVLFGMIGGQS
jgi:succinate dehydrogenase / fumarate reductase cytochrome b subunit